MRFDLTEGDKVSEQTDLSNEAVEVINAGAKAPLVLVCEHAAREIPACFDGLGLDAAARESHVAWDPGALAVAQTMAQVMEMTGGCCQQASGQHGNGTQHQ